jgi:Domain of unknown function (DUF1918)
MRAAVGDHIRVQGHHVGEHERSATILAVEGADNGPPYLVRWDSDGHESLFFPGSDTIVEHLPASEPGA